MHDLNGLLNALILSLEILDLSVQLSWCFAEAISPDIQYVDVTKPSLI